MPLLEALTIDVGTSIAKAILKRWLGGNDLISDAADSALDILKAHTSDRIAQQRAKRQFESIGEKVGESLLPVFEMEGAKLDEGTRTAIAQAAADTLNTATSEVLARRNLQPIEVAHYLLNKHPSASYHFSDAEGRLYERIVTEACTYIVDIASQLPQFTERTLAEVLKREGQMIAIAEKILQEVARMRTMLDPELEAARFELDYRRAVIRHLDELELFGSGMSVTSRRYSLSLAYVSLSLEQTVEYVDPHFDDKIDMPFHPEEERGPRSIRQVFSVEELLPEAQLLLIRGDAGSGKTTLLQWIAVQSAAQSFPPQLHAWNGTIPFYIRLRQHTHTDGAAPPIWPPPEAFPGLVAPEIAGAMPPGWVHQHLKSGRAIVLVDGVDEVPSPHRESVRTWLKNLIVAYPQTRFIVTSRPYAIGEGGFSAEGFKDAQIRPLELPEIDTFIDLWHKAVAANIQEHAEQEQVYEAARRLNEEIHRNNAKRALATNPLLCAMLCALHRERHQQLPSDRVALYEACCELLIEHRDMARHISLIEFPAAKLSYAQKSILLSDLAYWFIRNGWSEAPIQAVDERFTRRLKLMQEVRQQLQSSDARQLFVQRSAIIREPVAGSIDFAHRTFQEFLAAKAIVDEGDIGVLVQHAHNDQWREVVLLAAGLAAKKVREDLVERLIGRGETERSCRSHLYALAAACTQASHEKVGLNTRNRVERRLGALLPLKSVEEVEALAGGGELALPHLYPRISYTAKVAAACVRALIQIGGEGAMDVLAAYINDRTPEVIDALVAGIQDAKNKQTYAQRLLSHLKEIQPRSKQSLENLYHLPQLTSLDLGNLSAMSDLSVLEKLPQLTSLQLWSLPEMSDLTILERLPQLTSLYLVNLAAVSDLTILERLPQLTSLYLVSLPAVSDLTILERLPQLTSLQLQDLPVVPNLAPLEKLPQLSSLALVLDHLAAVPGLTILEKLPQLTSLWLVDLPDISALTILEKLPQLTLLWLVDLSAISTLSTLAKLPQLTSLRLDRSATVSDLSVLAKLPQLTSIELWDLPKVQEFGPLAHLPHLSKITLGAPLQIQDLNMLTHLPDLKRIELDNFSHDIAIPENLKKIVYVYRRSE